MTNFHTDTAIRAAADFIARVPAPKFSGLKDMLIVKPLDQKYGMIVMPETAESLTVHEPGAGEDAFLGVVALTGRGDRAVRIRCDECGAESRRILDRLLPSRQGLHDGHSYGECQCGSNKGLAWTVIGYDRLPFEVKRGDVIVMPRRPTAPGGEFELELEGEKYVAFYEEQFAYAVVEAAA
jgi:hypothetical protein